MKKTLSVILCIYASALLANAQRAPFNPPVRIPPARLPVIATPSSQTAPKPYWDPNRKVNPMGPAKGDPRFTTLQDFKFRLKGSPPLRDARGHVLGTLAPGTQVKINKGGARMMRGPDGKLKPYEFVLGARLKAPPGSAPVYVSGLISRSALKDKPALNLPKVPKVKGPTTAYSITGGNPNNPKLGTFDPSQQKLVPYKFRDRKTGLGYTTPNRQSTDYVARPIGPKGPNQKSYVNLLDKLPGKGGTAVTVYKVDKKNPVTFHRLKEVPAKTVKLYEKGGKQAGSMKFLKGYVIDPDTHKKTVGWVAQDAVKPKPKAKAGKKKSK